MTERGSQGIVYDSKEAFKLCLRLRKKGVYVCGGGEGEGARVVIVFCCIAFFLKPFNS